MARPLEPHERARFDQDAAAVSHMIALARKHRRGICVYSDVSCIGDGLLETIELLSHHDLVALAATCIARLADLPATHGVDTEGDL